MLLRNLIEGILFASAMLAGVLAGRAAGNAQIGTKKVQNEAVEEPVIVLDLIPRPREGQKSLVRA